MIDWSKPIEYHYHGGVFPAKFLYKLQTKNRQNIVIVVTGKDGEFVIYCEESGTFADPNYSIRNKKTEKKGWINLIKGVHSIVGSAIYSSKEEAIKNRFNHFSLVGDPIEITWYE